MTEKSMYFDMRPKKMVDPKQKQISIEPMGVCFYKVLYLHMKVT